jgi:hypothetical protein
MSRVPKRTIVVLAVAAVTLAVVHQAGSARGQGQGAAVQRGPQDVRVLSLDDQQAARALAPGDRGATYYYLEGLAQRVTSRFSDAVAVVERGADGRLKIQLKDLNHNELATASVSAGQGDESVLAYGTPSGPGVLLAVERANARPTLDWAARQTYRLWKDARDGDVSRLKWQDGLARAAGRGRPAGEEPLAIDAEFPGGFVAASSHTAGPRPHPVTGDPVTGRAVITTVTRDGLEIGRLGYYVEEQVIAWSLPGITIGYVDRERLEPIGGLPFTPDLAWASVQAFAFDHFAAQIAAKGFVAERNRGWLEKAVDFWVPTLQANDPGCDGLHWLDGSVLRFCCDIHDACYEKYGCTASSWWRIWSSWRCDYCNLNALYCFVSGGTRSGPPYVY